MLRVTSLVGLHLTAAVTDSVDIIHTEENICHEKGVFGCTPESHLAECVDVVEFRHIESNSSPVFATNDTFSAQLNGYHFWFVSENNKVQFETDPWKYAPAYGGF